MLVRDIYHWFESKNQTTCILLSPHFEVTENWSRGMPRVRRSERSKGDNRMGQESHDGSRPRPFIQEPTPFHSFGPRHPLKDDAKGNLSVPWGSWTRRCFRKIRTSFLGLIDGMPEIKWAVAFSVSLSLGWLTFSQTLNAMIRRRREASA